MGSGFIVTRQEALQTLQQKYGRNIPVSELQKLPPRTTPTQPRPPTIPTSRQAQIKQEEVRARHRYERPDAPIPKPVTEQDVIEYKRQSKLIKAKLKQDKEDAKYEVDGKILTKTQIQRQLGQSETDLNRYLKQREEIRKLHFNPDTGEPIWNEIPFEQRKYYPGAKEYFSSLTDEQKVAYIGADRIRKYLDIWDRNKAIPVDAWKLITEVQGDIPYFMSKVAQKLRLTMSPDGRFIDRDAFERISGEEVITAVRDVLWDAKTEIDPSDKWFRKLHPFEQSIISFTQAGRQASVGIATFPVDIAEKVSGQKVPYISDIKTGYQQWEQQQFVGMPGPTSYAFIKGFGTPEEKDWLAKQEKDYAWLMVPTTFGEVAGYYAGAKIPRYAFKGAKSLITKTGKFAISKVPKITTKLPTSLQKYFDRIYGTEQWKTATKWAEKGYKPGYDVPLVKTKYTIGEGPSGISYTKQGWEVTKAGKIKTYKGFGKRTFLSPEEVAKFEAKFKPAKRLKPATFKEFAKVQQYQPPVFKTKDIYSYERFWKPKSTFGFKKVKIQDAFIRAEKDMFVGKTAPPSRQLLAPKQKITVVKMERIGLGEYIKKPTVRTEVIKGWKLTPEKIIGDKFTMSELKPTRFKITRQKVPKIKTPLTESQFLKQVDKTVTKDMLKEQTIRKGYSYIKDTGKITKGPAHLEASFGKDFIMYEPKYEFIMKDVRGQSLVKGVVKGKLPYSPEQFPQIYGKEWGKRNIYEGFKTTVKYTPKPIIKDVSALQKLGFKPQITKTIYDTPGVKKALRIETMRPLGSIKVPSSAFKSGIDYAKAFERISIPATILSRDTRQIPIQQTDVARIQVPAMKQAKILLPETLKVTKYVQETKKVPSLISPTKPISKPVSIKIKVPPMMPPPIKSERKAKVITGYQTFVKTHKKYRPYGIPLRTKQQAKGQGATIVDNTVSRYFKVKSTKKRAIDQPAFEQTWNQLQHKFKQQNDTFIEHPQFARDTPGELAGATPEFKTPEPKFIGWKSPSSKHIKRGKEFIYMKPKEMFK